MSGHTATPWRVSGLIDARYLRGIGEVLLVRSDRAGDDRYIAMCSLDAMGDGSEICTSPEERQANAAFIVTACNSHADLVRALEELLRFCDVASRYERENPEKYSPYIDARAALATLTARKVG